MRKPLALSVAFILVSTLVLAFLPAAPAYAAADSLVTRRALLVGNTNYAVSPLQAPAYDAKHMEELFKQMSFSGASGGSAEQGAIPGGNIVRKADRTGRQILQDITAAFAGADADDVSYFYYSGHGSVLKGEAQIVGVDMAYVSVTELKAALDQVPGTKIILLDSCYSGGLVNKSSQTQAITLAPVKAAAAALPGHNNPKFQRKQPDLRLDKKKDGNWDALFPASLKQLPPKPGETLAGQFLGSVQEAFSKTSKFIDSGKYVVITAAGRNQYSFEFPFAATYGPSFLMNGTDWADRSGAFSGEFTGMLVAGAGIVKFNDFFSEVSVLADYNHDRKVTTPELERYLSGAVTMSDVQAYPSAGDEDPLAMRDIVLFEIDPAAELANGPRVVVADHATPVEITVTPPANLGNKLVIYQYLKETDGFGANGAVTAVPVRTFENASGTVSWDGKDEDGNPVADGTYRVELQVGEGLVQEDDPPYIYPSATLVMARGQTPLNEDWTAFFAGSAPWTLGRTVAVSAEEPDEYVYFTAPATGAMNLYADVSGLDPRYIAVCALSEADGDIVNYNMGSPRTGVPLYLPFAVEQGQKYYLLFTLLDTQTMSAGAGSFPVSLKLNGTVDAGLSQQVPGGESAWEAWLLKPAVDAAVYIRGTGEADTAATLMDVDQIERIASNDDFNDRQFLIRQPLVPGYSYLLVVRNHDAGELAYGVSVSHDVPVFHTAGMNPVGPPYGPQAFDVAGDGATYRVITTGPDLERWTFFTGQRDDGPEIGQANDPYLLLMDGNYNPIASSDDYVNGSLWDGGMGEEGEEAEESDQYYNAALSALLEPNTVYILSCRSAWAGDYDYTVMPDARVMAEGDYVIRRPKAVYTDNGGISLDRFGNVMSWGSNESGELGLGTMDPAPTPQAVILPYLDQAVDVWAAGTMVFARLGLDTYCYWGMPYDSLTGSFVPVMLDCLDGMDVADIQCGAGQQALVRTYTGDVWALDLLTETLEPVEIPGVLPHSVRQVEASDFSFFALTWSGELYAWGSNWTGECGVGHMAAVDVPTQVNFSGKRIRQVAAGWDHVLALSTEGDVYAWGYNRHNELGLGAKYTKTAYNKPEKLGNGSVAGLGIAAVYAGANHSMCLDAGGGAHAWGINTFGELGLGHASRVTDPKKIGYYDNEGVAVQSMAAGMFAVFAQDYDHNVYGYGSNMDYQLGHDGMPDKNGIRKLMTLRGQPATGHSAALAAAHADTGYAVMDGDQIIVFIGEDKESCYILPEPADSEAVYTINGESVLGKEFAAPDPGAWSEEIRIAVTHTGEVTREYSLTIYREECTNAKLRSIGLTAGAALSPEYSMETNNYTVTLPETMVRARVTPEVDGFGAHYQIDTPSPSQPKDASKLYTLAVGQTLYSRITVTAQSGDTEDYNLTIRRPLMLSVLSGRPVASGYPSLSPGGTNRMRIYYSLSFPATVKIQVKKSTSSIWSTILSRAETAAGALYYDWNGKIGSAYAAAGTYSVRVTPYYNNVACTAKLMTVKILGRPAVSVPTLTPATFTANGTNRLTFTVRWTAVSNVKVEIVNAAGTPVYTVWDITSQLPATKTLYWYGKNTAGALVPAGTYRVKVTCGGAAAVYKSFTVRR